jgi:hypothetical protein
MLAAMYMNRVETAGDAYLAAGGLMTTDEDGFIRVDTQPDPVQGAMRILQVGSLSCWQVMQTGCLAELSG